jgi:uncharacterized protein YkwD
MIYMHNEVRTAAGLSLLSDDDFLREAATRHAQWMRGRRRLTHWGSWFSSPSSRVRKVAGDLFVVVTENIAFYPRGDSQLVVDAWMKSRGHAANILNPDFTKIGWHCAGDYWCAVYGAMRK